MLSEENIMKKVPAILVFLFVISMAVSIWSETKSVPNQNGGRSIVQTYFGTCCKDLHDALTQTQHSFFRIEENGVLYLTVGYVDTANGPGFFDQAVIYCPFCGKQLQTKDEIKKRGGT